MLMIRLQRIGRKHDPHFRVIVTEKTRGPKSGKFVEQLGFYNPKAGKIELKEDRIKYWLDNGAQASGTVHNFLIDKGVVGGKKIDVVSRKKKKKEEEKKGKEKPKTKSSDDKPQEDVDGAKEEATETPQEEKNPNPADGQGEEAIEAKEETKEPEAKKEVKEELKEESKPELKPETKKTEEDK